jgi:hypothetical protein
MSFLVRGLWAIAVALVVAAPAVAKPDYIEVTPDALTTAFGDRVAKRAFSDELTDRRASMINDTFLPSAECGARPKFTLRETQPYKIDATDVMWIERYDVACKPVLRRSLLVIQQDGNLKVIGLLPGTTGADPSLQLDASNIVGGAAVLRLPSCDDVSITDTELTQPPQQAGGPWKERWTVSGCKKSAAIDVNFNPSPRGGTDVSVVATK